MTRSVLIMAVLAAAGCAKDPDQAERPGAGNERGDCYGNGTCNEGLICLSNLCVRPPPADCNKVAQKIGYLTLSNWAPRSERAELESRMLTECQNAHLSKEDGDCILRAQDRAQLASCPRPLGLGSCARMIQHVRTLAGSDPKLAKLLDRGVDRLMAECQEEGLTAADEKCVLAAKHYDDLMRCDPGKR